MPGTASVPHGRPEPQPSQEQAAASRSPSQLLMSTGTTRSPHRSAMEALAIGGGAVLAWRALIPRIAHTVNAAVRDWLLRTWYTTSWAVPLYYALSPPAKASSKSWCALLVHGGVTMPAQNIWRSVLRGLDEQEFREDDVIVVTFPKAGTHALTNIVLDLLTIHSDERDREQRLSYVKRADRGRYPLFLEFGHPFFKADDQKQIGRRLFCTHLPISLFPANALRKGCRIVYLARSPVACTLSALAFCRAKERKLREPTVEELVDSEWLAETQLFSGWHSHVADWAAFQERSATVLPLLFEDIIADTQAAVQKLSDFLGTSATAEQMQAIASSSSVGEMRKEVLQHDAKYYRRGTAAPEALLEWERIVPAGKRCEFDTLYAERWAALDMQSFAWLRGYSPEHITTTSPRHLANTPPSASSPPPSPDSGQRPLTLPPLGSVALGQGAHIQAHGAQAPLRVGLVGLGPHARRVYLPHLARRGVRVAVVIDVEDQRGIIEEFLKGIPLESRPERAVYLPQAARGGTELHPDARDSLNAAQVWGLIVSCDPLCRLPYIEYAFSKQLRLLIDKPPIVPSPFDLSPGSARRLSQEFERLLALDQSPSVSTQIMVQRRAHAGYQFVRALLSSFVREWQVPISFIDIYHADGEWAMPGELCTRDGHPYKHGFGKLLHSGYHFVDLLMWLQEVNKECVPSKAADSYSLTCHRFGLKDSLHQCSPEDLQRLTGASHAHVKASMAQVPQDLESMGELNVHAQMRFEAGDKLVCAGSLNLLQNSFSRRGWFLPKADTYKGNGRVRHERLVVHVGTLLSVHVHSYQAHEVNQRDPVPPAGHVTKETREALRACGLEAPSESSAPTGEADVGVYEYGPGHLHHFDVTIYRNTSVVGGVPVETVQVGRLLQDVVCGGGGDAGGGMGHNELARYSIIDEWLGGGGGGGLSPLRKQRQTVALISRMYEQLAAKREGGGGGGLNARYPM